ncbi:MAG: phenylalanine--tRNA ligase subunit beta, partial [Gemmatimonadaceae bacterium]
TLLVIDVLPNRADLLSHLGLAREIAAATGESLQWPKVSPSRAAADPAPATPSIASAVPVDILDARACRRYMGAHISGLSVGPSPDWLVARIEAVGSRSINNVVDATNYMLHGFGQPMHAFDFARLDGPAVIVRRAREGEKLVTLDGLERELDDGVTVIADAARAQAIAGVIGGKASEVTAATTDIFLEAAAFDAAGVRATSRRLGISTDASYRFERGVDSGAMPELMTYAVELIVALAGGKLVGDVIDVSFDRSTTIVNLRPSRVERVLGVEISIKQIQRDLESVGFSVEDRGTTDELRVAVPSYRADVMSEIDLIEDVARLHGYSEFPSDIRPFRPGTVPDAALDIAAERVRVEAIAAGIYEARPMPFVRSGDDSLRVRNPLAEDEAFLRTSVIDSLARRAEYNLAHMQRNVRLFEIGTVFSVERRLGSAAPRERMHAAAVILGERRPPHFTEPRPPHFDEWDAKALGLRLARAAYPHALVEIRSGQGGMLWTVTVDGAEAGWIRSVALDAPVWASPAFGIEIDIEGDGPAGSTSVNAYRPVPAMPAMQVDLALVVPDGTLAETVEDVIRREAGELLESLVLFDEFRGPGVPDGSRSLAWALTFRHPERTLRDKEIHGRTGRILTALERVLGIRQRTT